MSRGREMLRRQWTVYEALRSRRRGLTIAQLIELAGSSRATIYRYIGELSTLVPVVKERVNGEVRYRLIEEALPAFALRPDEVAALALAREMLDPLEGTRIVEHLDALLRRLASAATPPSWLSVAAPSTATDKGALRAIDLAIREGHRLGFDYRGERRAVDPIAVRVHRRHPYLIGYDVGRDDWRTFKVARIDGELTFEGPADPRSDYDESSLFAHAMGVWSAEPVDVVVRLSATVAERAGEYPINEHQRIEARPDGSVLIRATVAGLTEIKRWILAWGSDAEALAPDELREAVRAELEEALESYDDGLSHRAETGLGKG